MIAYVFLVASVLLGVFGQVGLKYAAVSSPRFWIINPAFNEYFVLAACVYFLSAIFYTLSLRALPLQVAFPSVSVSYVAVAWLSHLIWGTPFGWREIFALLFILLGIGLLFSRGV